MAEEGEAVERVILFESDSSLTQHKLIDHNTDTLASRGEREDKEKWVDSACERKNREDVMIKTKDE